MQTRTAFQSSTNFGIDPKKLVSGCLAKDLRVNGTSPAGQKYVMVFRSDQPVLFHDFKDGVIAGGTLKDDVTIDGVTFKAGTLLSTYDDGGTVDRIYEGTLAKDAEIQGKTYEAGWKLTFSP
jgi:hypothetical protein